MEVLFFLALFVGFVIVIKLFGALFQVGAFLIAIPLKLLFLGLGFIVFILAGGGLVVGLLVPLLIVLAPLFLLVLFLRSI